MKAAALMAVVLIGLAAEARAADGLPFDPAPTPPELNNPWPVEWEKAFRERAVHVLSLWKGKKPGGGTWGENEKNYYPTAMMLFLNGDRAAAVKIFEEPDYQKADHAWTNGVDFYWCFTLKGQMRKYFYFGPYLSDAYRKNFYEGARIWTSEDPKVRRHPVYGNNPKGGEGWGPDVKGSCVDRRNTDNLRAMSDTSIYLMAEETRNEATRLKYRQRIADYVQTLYNIGMSEWDSPNYHSHALSTYANLYDFAKDSQTKLLAKAALDWLYAAGAVKYYHAGFVGPNARDYGGYAVFGQNVSHPLWLYFADTPGASPTSDRDDVYHITSSYRPPAAVVELARKNFARPVEILATHPPYENWALGQPAHPAFWETTYIGNTFQMGSCVARDTGGPWNISAFKLLAENSQRGADYVVINTESVLGHSFKRPGDQVAQYRNLLAWLRPASPARPFMMQLPKSAAIEKHGEHTLIRLEKTFLAIGSVNLGPWEELTIDALAGDSKKAEELRRIHGADRFVQAMPRGDGYAGFVMEVGEGVAWQQFKDAVGSKLKIDLSRLAGGTVRLTGTDGATLEMTHNRQSELPSVARNGVMVNWQAWLDRWRPTGGDTPIRQKWMSGELRVEAGGKVFVGRLDKESRYTFENR